MNDPYRIGLKNGIREIHFKMDDLNFTTKNAESALIKPMIKPLSAISQKFILMTTTRISPDKTANSYRHDDEGGSVIDRNIGEIQSEGGDTPLPS